MSNKGTPAASAATEHGRLADDEAEFDSVGHVNSIGRQSNCDADEAVFRRSFVFDLELAGDASTVTVFEGGAPRFKRSMTYADIERLLDQLPTSPVSRRPRRP